MPALPPGPQYSDEPYLKFFLRAVRRWIIVGLTHRTVQLAEDTVLLIGAIYRHSWDRGLYNSGCTKRDFPQSDFGDNFSLENFKLRL